LNDPYTLISCSNYTENEATSVSSSRRRLTQLQSVATAAKLDAALAVAAPRARALQSAATSIANLKRCSSVDAVEYDVPRDLLTPTELAGNTFLVSNTAFGTYIFKQRDSYRVDISGYIYMYVIVVYIHIYVYTYTYIYMYIYVYIHIYNVYTYKCARARSSRLRHPLPTSNGARPWTLSSTTCRATFSHLRSLPEIRSSSPTLHSVHI